MHIPDIIVYDKIGSHEIQLTLVISQSKQLESQTTILINNTLALTSLIFVIMTLTETFTLNYFHL